MDALIVSESKPIFTAIAQTLRTLGEYNFIHAVSGSQARIICLDRTVDIVIVDKVADDNAVELSKHLAEKKEAGVILLTDLASYEETAHNLEQHGIIVLSKPLNKALFNMAIRITNAVNYRVRGYVDKAMTLEKKISEIKLVNRAKLVLMERLKYSEEKAHRHIEKTAMDMRVDRRTVAMNILKTYDN